jgi:serine/threonine-protein kinase
MALEPAKLSDFVMAGALGSGTTARVYEATHGATGRPVAIKLMEVGAAGDLAPRPHEMRERFAREALLLAGVESKHVSKILGYGFEKGQPFLVLERLQGETLDTKLRRDGPVPPAVAARWVEQLLVGVRDCHHAKIIHRDIKPSNIFIHREAHGIEVVKLIDFGVARLREIAGDTGLTSTNQLIGSVGYMAPEQFSSARSVGYAADLYAVGVVVFRTLTGRLPFVSRSIQAIIRMKSEEHPPPISSMSPIRNRMLDWFVQKAMAREPEARFRSAREMLDHWRVVAQTLEDEGTTDVMQAVPVAEAETVVEPPHQPPRREPSSLPTRRRAKPPIPPPSADRMNPNMLAERELARLRPRSSSGGGLPPSAPIVPSPTIAEVEPDPEAPPTIRQAYSADGAARDVPPRTIPSHALEEATRVEGGRAGPRTLDDPDEVTTRNDPNLRKLVERELELQKRKRGG